LVSRSAPTWRIWRHLSRFDRRLIPDKAALPRHVAFYPAGSIGMIAEPGAYTGSPVLMLLGEKDRQSAGGEIEKLSGLRRVLPDIRPRSKP